MLNRINVTTIDGFVVELSAPESFWLWAPETRQQWLNANFGGNGWREVESALTKKGARVMGASGNGEGNPFCPLLRMHGREVEIMKATIGLNRTELSEMNEDRFVELFRGYASQIVQVVTLGSNAEARRSPEVVEQ